MEIMEFKSKDIVQDTLGQVFRVLGVESLNVGGEDFTQKVICHSMDTDRPHIHFIDVGELTLAPPGLASLYRLRY